MNKDEFIGFLLALAFFPLYFLFVKFFYVPADSPTAVTVAPETSAVCEFTETTEAAAEAATEPQEKYHGTFVPYEPPVVDETEAEMLAILIYQEVGGDRSCDLCRRRVADVALNRVADPRFPDTLEAVMTAPRQYGLLHWTGIKWADRAKNPNEAHAVERARRIAREVLQGRHSDLYGLGYVWQAGFVQGRDNIYHCGHYFGR